MSHSVKRLHDDDDPSVQAFNEANEMADRTCRKEFETRQVEETVTDVKTAIRHLPKRYFKNVATNTGICLQNTQSGIRTIVGRIKRVRRQRVEKAQKTGRAQKILTAAAIALALAAAAGVAYLFVNSLLECYSPSPSQTAASAKL